MRIIELVLYFFLSVRNGGRKFYRIIELVLYFFIGWRKFYASFGGNTTLLTLLIF